MPDAWHPIMTAPKDGTLVLLYEPMLGDIVIGYWHWSTGDAWIEERTETALDAPTHWMPLPPPPQES